MMNSYVLMIICFYPLQDSKKSLSAGNGRGLQNPSTVSFTSVHSDTSSASSSTVLSVGQGKKSNTSTKSISANGGVVPVKNVTAKNVSMNIGTPANASRNVSIPGKRPGTSAYSDVKLVPQPNPNGEDDDYGGGGYRDAEVDTFAMKKYNHHRRPRFSSASSWKHASDRERTQGTLPLGQKQQQQQQQQNKMAVMQRKIPLSLARLEDRTQSKGQGRNGNRTQDGSVLSIGGDGVLESIRSYSTLATEGESTIRSIVAGTAVKEDDSTYLSTLGDI